MDEIHEPDLGGDVRFVLTSELFLDLKSGDVRVVNALTIERKNPSGRWAKALPHPLIAVDDNRTPTRGELLRAAARIVECFDEGETDG
jgi:hypothetical protein